ncbi:unnamed protein product [Aureobasidium mustum]|uniref:Uncharacterized protein n=1 Tax=Aureobasidium mustum TaxID=2773714 RepID=A0A9N8JZ36_9PEZI|nr:unnamed protein product [Aureobasidium mustum]
MSNYYPQQPQQAYYGPPQGQYGPPQGQYGPPQGQYYPPQQQMGYQQGPPPCSKHHRRRTADAWPPAWQCCAVVSSARKAASAAPTAASAQRTAVKHATITIWSSMSENGDLNSLDHKPIHQEERAVCIMRDGPVGGETAYTRLVI